MTPMAWASPQVDGRVCNKLGRIHGLNQSGPGLMPFGCGSDTILEGVLLAGNHSRKFVPLSRTSWYQQCLGPIYA